MIAKVWIGLLAYEARLSQAEDRRRDDGRAMQGAVRSRVVAKLRRAVVLDLERFPPVEGVTVEWALASRARSSAPGFTVSRTDDGSVTRRMAVDLKAGVLMCRYAGDACVGARSNPRPLAITPRREGGGVALWDEGIERTFSTVGALSAFLLTPMLDAANGDTARQSTVKRQ